MVTKGQIISVDYAGNTCEVRLPYFESAGVNDKIIATATIGNQPGMYNGYRAGDVVWVAFEDGEANKPVVIGKLFLGVSEEKGDPRGVMNVESGTVSNSMNVPLNTSLAYEKDSSIAQNGETKYDKISDLANKLATITAQQDKTAYDVTGVITTADLLKSEISAVKAGSGNKNTYAQETKPADETYTAVASEEQEKLTETSDYVGYYVLIDGKYEVVTNENKDSLSIYPPYTKAYKLQKLEQGDLWVYTGQDIFEKIGTKEKATDYIGTYVYYKGDAITTDAPISAECPDCEKADFFKAAEGYSFKFIDASNYASIPTSAQAYKKHLANNATFSYNGKRWDDATSSDVIAYGSAITQTANSVSAKVNKTHLDGTSTKFGWQLHEQIDGADISITETQKPGDADGQFTVYSQINYSDASKAAKIKDVLHINKNGMWVNGNLEVEDDDGQKIFRALPYGEYTKNGEDELIYNGDPKVEIGGFTADKTTLKNENIGFRVGSTGLSITNSGKDQFSVLSDGTICGKKLYIEQDEKHESGSASYFDGNVCGHQMKVDTVELATTNTGNGDEQTAGFRVEDYTVEAKEENNEHWINFGIKDVSDARGTSTTSDACVWCVLQNKKISAAVEVEYYIDEEKEVTKTVAFSVIGTLAGYPYETYGKITDAQKNFNSIKKAQAINLVQILADKNQICTKTKKVKSEALSGTDADYEDGEIAPVRGLENIKCYGIEKCTVTSFTPRREEYYTGDFVASTGFFKDRNGCFTEGAAVDVFSLPWTRRIKSEAKGSATQYFESEVPVQILQTTKDDKTVYYAYKELRKGDFAEIASDNNKILPYCQRAAIVFEHDTSYRYLRKYGYWLLFTDIDKETAVPSTESSYFYSDLEPSFAEILPVLDHYTTLTNVNSSLIRKYLTGDMQSLRDGDGWNETDYKWAQSESEYFKKASTIGLSPTYANAAAYDIHSYWYGSNVQSVLKDKEIIYNPYGTKIRFCVDSVGKKMTDAGMTDDIIYVFCSRPLYCYRSESESLMVDDAKYKYLYKISPIPGDMLSLLLYGSNAAVTCDENTGQIKEKISTQSSSAYLCATNSTDRSAYLTSNQYVIGQNTSLSVVQLETVIDNEPITPLPPIWIDKWVA